MGAGSAMDGIFDDDDDDDMFIQASSTDVDHNAEDNVGNDDDNDGAADDDDDAASIDLGIIKKQLMPLIMNEDSNATGNFFGFFFLSFVTLGDLYKYNSSLDVKQCLNMHVCM